MSNIAVSTLHEDCKRTFKMTGAGTNRFDSDFVRALNRAIDRINRQADLATRVSHVANTSGTVTLDEAYEDVLYDLCVVGLMKTGQRPAKGMQDNMSLYTTGLDDRIDDIRQDILNQAVEADTDDETDYVGLGALNA